MKFQSLLLTVIFATWIAAKRPRKLTQEENYKRLESCGKDGFSPTTNFTKVDTWFWASRNGGSEPTYSSAIQISSRHFFTFSQAVLTEDMKWRYDTSDFKEKCVGGNPHVEIPKKVLPHLYFIPIRCINDIDCDRLRIDVTRAHLLNFCDYYYSNKDVLKFFPMIVEVKQELEGDVPCILHSKFDDVKLGDSAKALQLFTIPKVNQTMVKVNTENDYVVGTDILGGDDVGGPLLKEINGKWTVIGYSGLYNEFKFGDISFRGFQRMYRLQTGICDLTGICGAAPRATTGAPTKPKTTTRTSPTSPVSPKDSTSSGFTTSSKITSLPSDTSVPSPTQKEDLRKTYMEYEAIHGVHDDLIDVRFSEDDVENGKMRNFELIFLLIIVLVA